MKKFNHQKGTFQKGTIKTILTQNKRFFHKNGKKNYKFHYFAHFIFRFSEFFDSAFIFSAFYFLYV